MSSSSIIDAKRRVLPLTCRTAILCKRGVAYIREQLFVNNIHLLRVRSQSARASLTVRLSPAHSRTVVRRPHHRTGHTCPTCCCFHHHDVTTQGNSPFSLIGAPHFLCGPLCEATPFLSHLAYHEVLLLLQPLHPTHQKSDVNPNHNHHPDPTCCDSPERLALHPTRQH